MSVFIKGMEMPENCTRCDYIGLNVAIGCPVMSGLNGRATDCPLVEVPTPHGRLIDADDVKSRMIPLSFSVQKWISEVELSNCKTVIKEEKE